MHGWEHDESLRALLTCALPTRRNVPGCELIVDITWGRRQGCRA